MRKNISSILIALVLISCSDNTDEVFFINISYTTFNNRILVEAESSNNLKKIEFFYLLKGNSSYEIETIEIGCCSTEKSVYFDVYISDIVYGGFRVTDDADNFKEFLYETK